MAISFILIQNPLKDVKWPPLNLCALKPKTYLESKFVKFDKKLEIVRIELNMITRLLKSEPCTAIISKLQSMFDVRR